MFSDSVSAEDPGREAEHKAIGATNALMPKQGARPRMQPVRKLVSQTSAYYTP